MTTQKKKPAKKAAPTLPPGAHSIQVRRQRVATAGKKKVNTATISHVHETREIVSLIEFTPPHPPRRETSAFEHTRHQLVNVLDKPCLVCGVRQSILSDPVKAADKTLNPQGAKEMHAHHDPIEWSMVDAVDWRRVHEDFPQVVSQETLLAFLDSAANMSILCDVNHIGPIGWHHVTYPDARIQRYLRAGYVVAGSEKTAAAAEAKDEQIEQAAGIEQAVDQQIAASVAATPDPSATPGASKPRRPRRAPKVKVALA